MAPRRRSGPWREIRRAQLLLGMVHRALCMLVLHQPVPDTLRCRDAQRAQPRSQPVVGPSGGARTGRPKIRGCAVAGCGDSDVGKLTAPLRANVGTPPGSSTALVHRARRRLSERLVDPPSDLCRARTVFIRQMPRNRRCRPAIWNPDDASRHGPRSRIGRGDRKFLVRSVPRLK